MNFQQPISTTGHVPSHGDHGLLMILRAPDPSLKSPDMTPGYAALVDNHQVGSFHEGSR